MKTKVLTIISVFLLTIATFQILFNILDILSRINLIDFTVYRGAIEKFWQGQNPYNFLYAGEVAKDPIPFNYPPSALIILSFMAVLPWKITQIFLLIMSIFCLWVSLWFTWKLTNIKLSYPHFFILLAFFTQTFPVKFTLVLGQINLILLAVTMGAIYVYEKNQKKNLISAILLGVVAAVKLFPFALLPLWFFRKKLKFIFLVPVLFSILSVLPSFDLFTYYFLKIGPSLSNLSLHNYHDQSIFQFFLRITNNLQITKFLGFTVAISLYSIILFFFFKNKRSNTNFIEAFLAILALTSISNFFSWQHHFVFAYPLILLLYLKNFPFKKHINTKILYNFLFLIIWLGFIYHFEEASSTLISNPFFVSSQTFLVLGIVIWQIISSWKVYKKYD